MTALYHTPHEIRGMTLKKFNQESNYLIDEVKARASKKGSHFFDTDTMRFFSSRVLVNCWKLFGREDIYFITSEADKGHIKHAGSVRAYTVRKCELDGNIETVGKFQEHATKSEAVKAIKEALEQTPDLEAVQV